MSTLTWRHPHFARLTTIGRYGYLSAPRWHGDSSVTETQTNNTSTCAPRARHNDRSRAGRSLTWRLAVALLTLAALLAPPIASATSSWWNRDWRYRKAITIKLPAMSATGTPAEVVLPIRLHAGDFSYFQDVQPSGADLRFLADDGTPLKYQLELLDPAAGLLVAWIEVPVKAGVTEQPVWMYYGNPPRDQAR